MVSVANDLISFFDFDCVFFFLFFFVKTFLAAFNYGKCMEFEVRRPDVLHIFDVFLQN